MPAAHRRNLDLTSGVQGVLMINLEAAFTALLAGRTGLISSTSTLSGVVGTLLLLHESLSSRTVAGGVLMFLGLAGLAWESARRC